MRLAKVTLAGFKSFADPVDFRFQEQKIGIVGPNGCGKSNVVDAIKCIDRPIGAIECIDYPFNSYDSINSTIWGRSTYQHLQHV